MASLVTAGVGLYTQRKNRKAAQRAQQAGQFNPFSSQSNLGSVDFSGGKFDIQQGEFGQSVEQAAGQQLQNIQGQSADPTQDLPQSVQDAFANINPQQGGDFALNTGLTDQLQGITGDIFSQFQDFDRDAFASNIFDDLQGLAERGERTAAEQLSQGFFGQGRLAGIGEGSGAEGLARLAESQQDARTKRGLSALQFAGQREQQLAQLGLNFQQGAQSGLQQQLGVDQDRFTRATSTFGSALSQLQAGRANQQDAFSRFGGFSNVMAQIQQMLQGQAKLGLQGGDAQSGANLAAAQPVLEQSIKGNNAFADAITSGAQNFDVGGFKDIFSNIFGGKTSPTPTGTPPFIPSGAPPDPNPFGDFAPPPPPSF